MNSLVQSIQGPDGTVTSTLYLSSLYLLAIPNGLNSITATFTDGTTTLCSVASQSIPTKPTAKCPKEIFIPDCASFSCTSDRVPSSLSADGAVTIQASFSICATSGSKKRCFPDIASSVPTVFKSGNTQVNPLPSTTAVLPSTTVVPQNLPPSSAQQSGGIMNNEVLQVIQQQQSNTSPNSGSPSPAVIAVPVFGIAAFFAVIAAVIRYRKKQTEVKEKSEAVLSEAFDDATATVRRNNNPPSLNRVVPLQQPYQPPQELDSVYIPKRAESYESAQLMKTVYQDGSSQLGSSSSSLRETPPIAQNMMQFPPPPSPLSSSFSTPSLRIDPSATGRLRRGSDSTTASVYNVPSIPTMGVYGYSTASVESSPVTGGFPGYYDQYGNYHYFTAEQLKAQQPRQAYS